MGKNVIFEEANKVYEKLLEREKEMDSLYDEQLQILTPNEYGIWLKIKDDILRSRNKLEKYLHENASEDYLLRMARIITKFIKDVDNIEEILQRCKRDIK